MEHDILNVHIIPLQPYFRWWNGMLQDGSVHMESDLSCFHNGVEHSSGSLQVELQSLDRACEAIVSKVFMEMIVQM